jgi:hypothetical protein
VPTIRYTLKPDDMLDAWRWLVLKSPAFRKARWVRALAPISMVIIAMAIAIAIGAEMSGSLIAAGILLAILGALGWNLWREYPDSAAARIGRDWAKGAPPAAWAEVTLEVTSSSITATSVHVTSTYQWSAFTGYSDLAHCVVLWQGSTNCFVIPRRSLPEKESAELLEIVSGQLRVAA